MINTKNKLINLETKKKYLIYFIKLKELSNNYKIY